MTFKAQFGAGAETYFPKPIRVGNAILSYGRYLGKVFWPSKLALFYPHPGQSLKWSQVTVAFVVLLAITVVVLVNLRRRRYLAVGWLWFAGTLVPMIGIVQVGSQAMADRYAYLPLLGVFLMICWTAAEFAAQRHVPTKWMATLSVFLLLALSVVTHRQLSYWSDNVALWTHVLQITHNNQVAEDNLGGALMERGRLDLAMPHYYRAAEINSFDPTAHLNIGAYAQRNGNFSDAIEMYQSVLSKMHPEPRQKIILYTNLGYAYRDSGDYPDSRQSLERAAQLNPKDVAVWVYLGVACQRTGDLQAAISAYSRAMQIQPFDWAYLLLGRALEQSGRKDEALAANRQAKLLSHNFDEAQQTADRLLSH